MAKIKLKAKSRAGFITVRVLIKHPMESGNRKDKSGKIVPANHITNLILKKNNRLAAKAAIGGSISENPFFQFKIPGVKGDEIRFESIDNLGKTLQISKVSK
ncbi:thiosulfate oxidation carrier complex protein SoxZ [Candidatus Thioglobus autotrophicus]|uniref:thiosulfate oxidation carrier complex protein SoxZ n=1 Tax=Candidatus Thioglobus autotrophicus TaxID=1705394 RepID=UPI00299F158E|nr:thiosulfate oxidation carrier complex protein SoxZ [Candidatus Thioglobus autotrophicus]WPE16618.1 thiosulfate oxidation carrier complex protein SoxZ [Candidatus Thioglobus autotrophicus]